MIRFRLSVLVAAGALAVVAVSFSHPAGAASTPKVAASASPSPAPSPTASPEPMDHAIPRLEAAVKSNPDDKQSMTELATDYMQIHHPELAVQLTQKLLAGGTKNAQIYFIDGQANAMLNKMDAGIASMQQASDLEPTNIQVLEALTQMYMAANRPADGERVAKRALTFNANSKDAIENYGVVLAQEKKYDEARAQFEAEAKLDPKDPHPIVLEARTYEDSNGLPLAQQLLDRALTVAPTNLEALISKTQVAAAQHDVKTAIATYALILAQTTSDAQKAYFVDQEATLYAREKMDSDADATFLKAINDYGSLPPAHLAYGDYLASKKDNAGALREWTSAAGPNRDNPLALARLGQLAGQNNDIPKAVDNFKRLTEVAANDPEAYLLLGQAYMANKNWSGAHDAFQASFNLQRTPEAVVGLAAADQQTRNYKEEIEIYEALDKNAAPLVKANPILLLNMANAYRSANQLSKAKSTYVRFLAFLKPGTQAYTQVQGMIASVGAKPAAKATAKPKPAPSATPKK